MRLDALLPRTGGLSSRDDVTVAVDSWVALSDRMTAARKVRPLACVVFNIANPLSAQVAQDLFPL